MSETVDLDPDEPPWIDRCVGYLERLLQSEFISSDQARDDIERLCDVLKATLDAKKPT